jgi:hypothetical protein
MLPEAREEWLDCQQTLKRYLVCSLAKIFYSSSLNKQKPTAIQTCKSLSIKTINAATIHRSLHSLVVLL